MQNYTYTTRSLLTTAPIDGLNYTEQGQSIPSSIQASFGYCFDGMHRCRWLFKL